jgi:hypothetical protein
MTIMKRSDLSLMLTMAVCFVCNPVYSASDATVFNRQPADYANAIHQALDADQPDQAYLQARAWTRAAPGDIPPLTALASVYLAFDAPAAALETIESALNLSPDPAETRRLQALKIQTLAELGQQPAAWANARDYLRKAGPDDIFAPIIIELQWSQFATYAGHPYDNVLARLETSASSRPLAPEQVYDYLGNIFASLRENLSDAYKSKEAEKIDAAAYQLSRFLLRTHYLPDPANPGQSFRLLLKYPDRAECLYDISPIALGKSLREWAPSALPVNDRDYNPRPNAPSEPPYDAADAFIAENEATFAELLPRIQKAIDKADAAASSSDMEAALESLLTLHDDELSEFRDSVKYEVALLDAWIEYYDYPKTEHSETLETWLKIVTNGPVVTELNKRLDPDLDHKTNASLLRRLATAYESEAATDPNDLLARVSSSLQTTPTEDPLERISNTDASTIEDFDIAIAQGIMTPAFWTKRLEVAKQLQDSDEIIWSTYEALASQPAKLAAWLAPLIAENDARIDAALTRLDNATTEEKANAILALKEALSFDPGHIGGLNALYAHFIETEQDDFASPVLESLWSLSPNDFVVDDNALALAARTANWNLLLSLSDDRIRKSDTDLVAHLHRQIAALALGYKGLVADSTPAFNGTAYMHQGRVLHWLAFKPNEKDYMAYVDPVTGLELTYDQMGIDHNDPVARLWFALGPKNAKGEPLDAKWERLYEGAAPDMISHLDYIQKKLEANDYLASHRGTPSESTALFVHHLMRARAFPAVANQSELAALALRQDLPLFLRAKAASVQTDAQQPTLRASDPVYAGENVSDWPAIWANLLPGQKIIPLGIIQLPENPATLSILRLSRPASSGLVRFPQDATIRSRLWELDGGLVFKSKDWQLANGQLVTLKNSLIESCTLTGEGSIWVESSDIVNTAATLKSLVQTDVQMTRCALYIKHDWTADLLRCDESIADLNAPNTIAHIEQSVFVNHQYDFFRTAPSTRINIMNTRFYTQKPIGLDPKQTTFTNSRLVGLEHPELKDQPGLKHTALNLTGPANFTASNAAELAAATKAAKSGDRIDLTSSKIILDRFVPINAGVLLRGAKDGTTLISPFEIKIDPLISIRDGDAWIENLTLDVERGSATVGVREVRLVDKYNDRSAVYAGANTFPFLRAITFGRWQMSPQNDYAIVVDGAQLTLNGDAPSGIKLSSGGRFDHLAYNGTGSITLAGSGMANFSHIKNRRYEIDGKNLDFNGAPYFPQNIGYSGGSGDPRILAWRQAARDHFTATLERLQAQLPQQLDRAGNLDERIRIFNITARQLSPIVKVTQESDPTIARAFAKYLNPAFSSRPAEFPFYMEAFYFSTRAFPDTVWLANAHSKTFDPNLRDRYKAHLSAMVDNQKRLPRGFTSSDRNDLFTYMRDFPVGDAYHQRAMAAFSRGEDPAIFAFAVAQERERQRQQLAYQAELERQRERQLEQQRRDAKAQALARINPPKKSWWETYSSANPRGSYNGSNSTGGSADQQMRNYRNQLNKNIYNAGRDYGQQRVY